MRLIHTIGEVFAEKLDNALEREGVKIIPVETSAGDGDTITLRNGAKAKLEHWPRTTVGFGPLSLKLKGNNYDWPVVLEPLANILARRVAELGVGVIASVLLPLPLSGDTEAKIIGCSTANLFAFRTVLVPDFEELFYILEFDALFGPVAPRGSNKP